MITGCGTTKRVRIIYVIDFLDTNLAGTENQLIKLINGLDKAKFEIQLLCFRDHPWLQANGGLLDCAKTIIDISQFGRFSTYLNILKLINYFRRNQPDIVHTFFPVANIVAVIAARLAGVRNVISSRRDYGEWMSDGYLAFTKLSNRFVRKIVANSQSVKALTVRVEGIAPDTVVVFHNGIDVAAFSSMTVNWTIKQKLGIPKDNKVIGIIANFRPMKRHDTFLRAAQGILAIRNDVDFLLVGHRNAADKSQVLAQELGIAERLHFVGSQPNVVPYLSVMDIGVNCSEREGLSNAVMEYMAAGVPCVVSQSGGNPDLITQGETGLTFPLGDHQALTTAVLTLLDNESLRRKFAQNAKEKVDRQLTVSFMLSSYHDFYCAMMQ